MSWFVAELRYADPVRRAEVRPAHLAYVRELAERGALVLAGPWTDGTGSMMIYEVPSEAEATQLLAQDPYSQSGVIELIRLREWSPVIRRDG